MFPLELRAEVNYEKTRVTVLSPVKTAWSYSTNVLMCDRQTEDGFTTASTVPCKASHALCCWRAVKWQTTAEETVYKDVVRHVRHNVTYHNLLTPSSSNNSSLSLLYRTSNLKRTYRMEFLYVSKNSNLSHKRARFFCYCNNYVYCQSTFIIFWPIFVIS